MLKRIKPGLVTRIAFLILFSLLAGELIVCMLGGIPLGFTESGTRGAYYASTGKYYVRHGSSYAEVSKRAYEYLALSEDLMFWVFWTVIALFVFDLFRHLARRDAQP